MADNFARDKNAIKDGMSPEDVLNFLSSLGVQGNWLDEGKLVFETACHNHIGEGSHKLYYYDNTKLFYCYTGCGRFDIFQLLSKMNVIENNEELSIEEAIDKYVNSQSFITLGSSETSTRIDLNDLNEKYVKPELFHYDKKEYLSLPRVVVDDWVAEGISAQTQYRYNVRYNYSMSGITFPHLDMDYNFVGIRQRLINKEMAEQRGKYRPLERNGIIYSSPLSFYLFGLAFNKNAIKKKKKAIVLEGEKSVMLMDDIFSPYNNIGVSTSGMHFSRHQYELLKSLGVKEIVFAFDRQFKEVGSQEFIELLEIYRSINDRFGDNPDNIKITFIFDERLLTDYRDAPVDKGFETFVELYNNRREYEVLKAEVRPETIWDNISNIIEDEEYDVF